MSWLAAILASAAIWIVGFLAMTGTGSIYPLLMLFLVVPVFLIPLLAVFGVAAAVARATVRSFVGRLLLFYAVAVPLAGAGLWLIYRAGLIPLEREYAVQLMKVLLVPSLLSSLVYPWLIRRT
jgi:hypothetical protein